MQAHSRSAEAAALGGLFPRRFASKGGHTQDGRAHSIMPKTPEDLLAFLESLGIVVSSVTHPPLYTVADSQALRGEIAAPTRRISS